MKFLNFFLFFGFIFDLLDPNLIRIQNTARRYFFMATTDHALSSYRR